MSGVCRSPRMTTCLLTSLLFLAGCGGSEQAVSLAVKADSFAVRYGETVMVPGTQWTVTFQSVTQDSRCPMSVQCVWAGVGEIVITVHRAGGDASLTLETSPPKNETTLDGVRFALRRLDPYPGGPGSRQASEYSVTLEVAPE